MFYSHRPSHEPVETVSVGAIPRPPTQLFGLGGVKDAASLVGADADVGITSKSDKSSSRKSKGVQNSPQRDAFSERRRAVDTHPHSHRPSSVTLVT